MRSNENILYFLRGERLCCFESSSCFRFIAMSRASSAFWTTLRAIVAGWLVVSASPLPIPTRFFDLFVIPNIAKPDGALFAGASLAHVFSAYAIACLVALHVAGALKHHLADRDDVLTRMLPLRAPRSPVR